MSSAWTCKLIVRSGTAVSSTVADSDAMVNLGRGIMCSRWAAEKLEHEEVESEWATTLLKGVFGDNAPYMRIRRDGKRSGGLVKTFDEVYPKFSDVAPTIYRRWLVAKKKKNAQGKTVQKYSDIKITKLCKTVMKYLSRQSNSILVSINNKAGIKRAKRQREPPSEAAAPSGSKKKAKTYVRRGEEKDDEDEEEEEEEEDDQDVDDEASKEFDKFTMPSSSTPTHRSTPPPPHHRPTPPPPPQQDFFGLTQLPPFNGPSALSAPSSSKDGGNVVGQLVSQTMRLMQ